MEKKFSKYNIFSKIKDSDKYFIINPLVGSADILENNEAMDLINEKYEMYESYLSGHGYLLNEEEERKIFNKKYLDFLDSREKDEVQIFYVPWYACNFACDYCYQGSYEWGAPDNSLEVIDHFFQYIDKEFKNRRKYITIFGGEPLLMGEKYQEVIGKLLTESKKRDLDVAVVTNGYYLSEYIDILKTGNIREIQVTLDGIKDMHNKRRFLKNHEGTFDKIVEGIDQALLNEMNINLRIVLDKENITELANLAEFAIQKGWTKNEFFKTQIGRNYELHICQNSREKLYTRLDLFSDIYKLIIENPQILEFHKPAYSIASYLFENGELPDPLFDSCPGCKTEWAFDYTGKIYSCTATVGKEGEQLATFYPSITIDEEKIEQWQERDITTIEKCRQCPIQLACGGGCASVSKNNTGKINSPDCRPVKELLELGISLYFKDVKN
jgi:uncharacterized protein